MLVWAITYILTATFFASGIFPLDDIFGFIRMHDIRKNYYPF